MGKPTLFLFAHKRVLGLLTIKLISQVLYAQIFDSRSKSSVISLCDARLLALLLSLCLTMLRGHHQSVVHDVLGRVAEHLPDLLGEGHLVLGRGDVLVIVEVAEHVPRAGLGLTRRLGGALEVELDLVEGGVEVLDARLKPILAPGSVRPVIAGLVEGGRPLSQSLVPLVMEDRDEVT